LNNDTKVEKDWLHHLVLALEEKNTIASSFVITEGIDKKYYKSNGSVSYLMYNIMNVFEDINDEFYPNGCSVIFRKSEIGVPFDSDYFYYSEDVYLGLKARFMGMKVRFVKDSIVRHYGGGSNSGTARRTFFQERNRLLNLYSFFSIWFLIRVYPYVLLNEFVKFIYSIFSPKYSFAGIIKAYFWICFHIPTIIKKRKSIKPFKKLHEKEVIKYMSSKIINGNGIINKISYLYSRLVGIKPVEYYNLNQDLPD
jgi:GT2 family glycosyltransferase